MGFWLFCLLLWLSLFFLLLGVAIHRVFPNEVVNAFIPFKLVLAVEMGLVQSEQAIFNYNTEDVFKICPARDLFRVHSTDELMLIWDYHDFIRTAAKHRRLLLVEVQEALWSDLDADLNYLVDELILHCERVALDLPFHRFFSLLLLLLCLFLRTRFISPMRKNLDQIHLLDWFVNHFLNLFRLILSSRLSLLLLTLLQLGLPFDVPEHFKSIQ